MQTLIVQTMYFGEADRGPATELGNALYDVLTRPRGQPLAFGAGIPVVVASSAAHVDTKTEKNLLVIPLLGNFAAADEATRKRAIAAIQVWHEDLGEGHVVPIFLSPTWRTFEDKLPGKAAFDHLYGEGSQSWTATVIAVVLAACRLVSDGANRPTIFISHAKADLAATDNIALEFRDYAKTGTTGEAFFDSTDLLPGSSLDKQLDSAAGRGVFVALRTDAYASRPWCERELLHAKRAGVPTLTVHVLKTGEQRSYPYSGNGPTVVWTPKTSLAEVFLRAAVEWLRARHFHLDARRLIGNGSLDAVVLPRPPELLDLAQGPLLDKAPMVVLHPDPEVSAAERGVLQEARPRMRLVTPTTFYRGLERRSGSQKVSAPLYGREIAFSVSDSADAGGDEGFTKDHVQDATVFIARALISAGGALSYGGDFRFGGNDELLAGLIVAYNASGQSSAELLISYMSAAIDPAAPGALRSDFPSTVRSLRSTEGIRDQALLPRPSGEVPPAQLPVYLSDMRRVMSNSSFARVVLGGQCHPRQNGAKTGYIGAYPGLLEEVWWSLRHGKPLFVLGGFGGVTRAIADVLDDLSAPPVLRPETYQTDPLYSEYRERCASFEADPMRSKLELPANITMMLSDIRTFGRQHLASDDTARAWNGLTIEENRTLFRSRDLVEITRLVMHGLYGKTRAAVGNMQRIELVRGSLLKVQGADAIVVAAFQNVPIGGAAAAVDQALSSRVSAALRARQTIVPIPTQDIDADWLMIADLGPLVAGDLSGLPEVIEKAAADVSDLARRNSFGKIGIVSFGSSGIDDLRSVVDRMLNGFKALQGKCTLQWFERDPDKYRQLEEILKSRTDIELSCCERGVEQARIVPVARDVVITTRYADEVLYTTMLPPEGAAAAFAIARPLTRRQLEELTRSNLRAAPREAMDDAFGETVARAMFGDSGCARLEALAQYRLVIQHDVDSAGIPFEALSVKGHRFSVDKGVVRRPALADLPLVVPRPVRTGRLNLLLVVDPTETLDGAKEEADAVLAAIQGSNVHVLPTLSGKDATRERVLEALKNPEVDVFHYCGHAFYDGPDSAQSGLLCAKQERLTGSDMASVSIAPRIAFFNACRSARVRDMKAMAPAMVAPEFTRAFAAYFLRGGIEAFLGTLWPVGDTAAAEFATSAYKALAAGSTLDQGIRAARQTLHAGNRPDWANYILYGDGSFHITSELY